MNIIGKISHSVSLFDIRLQTPLPYIIILRGNETEADDFLLKGSVVFSLNESITVKSIVFRFYGVNKVKWTELIMSSTKTPVERNQKQESLVFEKEISFLPFQGTKTIGKGNYEYPLEIVIPGNIPESVEPYEYENSMAYLVYKVKATIERPGLLPNINKHIRIIRTMPLSSINFIHTMFVEDTWLNKVDYNISIPTKIYELGSSIPINMRFIPLIKNLKLAKIAFSLKEYITLRVIYGHYGMPSKHDTTRHISTFKIRNFPENENEWKLEEVVKIPKSLSSCIQNCDVKHIKVRHKLKIVVTLINPDGHISELRASLPIVLLVSPSLFVNVDDYNHPLTLGFQPPSYNNHIYDPVWDGISSIHTHPALSREVVSQYPISDSDNSLNFCNSNSSRLLQTSANRSPLFSEESQSIIQDQNENNNSNHSSNQGLIPSNTPETTSPSTSAHHMQSQRNTEHCDMTTEILSSNRQPRDIVHNTVTQPENWTRNHEFIENLSQVPSYHVANRPISTIVTPISKSLPTYEAPISLSLQNMNETMEQQYSEQILKRRMKTINCITWFNWHLGPRIQKISQHAVFSIHSAIHRSFYGQITHITHPHLIKPTDLTPGISAEEYSCRRSRLATFLPPNSLVVLIGACLKYKTASSFYTFHQYPNFFYLTGVNEPWTIFIMERDSSVSGFQSYLFVRDKDPVVERWEGTRTGVYDLREVDHILSRCIRNASQIYIDYPLKASTAPARPDPDISSIFDKCCEYLESYSTLSITPWIHQLREIKSPAEIKLMKHAACNSAAAFNIVMQTPVKTERVLWAKLLYEFKTRDCEEAYVPVIAGGQNALTIHYTMNNMPLREGDVVLVDAGGEYANYVTDISRTWPVNGVFSAAQKDLYQAVLNVQKACIELCSEERAVSLDMIHQHSIQLLKEELKWLGFNISYSDLYHILYPHHIGHQIGLEVHDCSESPKGQLLKENQTITIEPGVYVPNLFKFPKHFRGLGIRIEDSILVGKKTPIILSKDAVKEVTDIEAICNRRKWKMDCL
ncbi:hypothetical protein PORY_001046 [Pneumocystis oryctolagi]|uniref:Uncharacterized protein n=1 Tax=Pneumocystis oryctolagi TaxID=42067 RepID=A0ACB7CDM3_9ASCO|nr:hypothetical protein PORY_001046 [Pneumocystis oryctolagi]